ncbi:hypothetical protein MRB53_040075 [Persea americana]|nr:hypothetical protein MRB53_040075 [Persea americana]
MDASSSPTSSIGQSQNIKADALQQIAEPAAKGDGSVFSQLLSNPFFTAGFGLAGLGAAVRYGSVGVRRTAELIKRRLLVDLEITRHDESYEWVLNWMTTHYQNQLNPSKRAGVVETILQRFTPGLHHLQIQTARTKTASGSEHTAFALVPGHGKHILRFRNAFIAVSRERVDIFKEAHDLATQRIEGKTVVYTSRNVGWDASGQAKRKRPFNSVVLQKGLAEKIVTDIREFLGAREWYLDRGIPYRRGYLLYGPPGTGKTSFVQALAGELDFNIAMLSLSQRGLTDDLLNHLLLNIPPRTLVLLEDVDAAFSNRRQRDEDGYSGANVTFSGLLNALDGVASAEERIIFMTTNHKDRLDEALIRPGRVDMTVQLGNATAWQMERLWDRFYAQYDQDGAQRARFMDRARLTGLIGNVSTAALQGLFLYNKESPENAIEMIGELNPSRVEANDIVSAP